MTNRILALVDGSDYSESVCHHAAWIADRLEAEVDVMHVLARPEGAASRDLSGTIGLGARTALLDDLARLDEQRARLAQARGRAILEDAERILQAGHDRAVAVHLRRGDLLQAVAQLEADLRAIVAGKRGEGADFAKGHLGSNVERIVRASTVPVLVASRAFRPVAKVLVAYDGSPSARRAIERMARSPVFAGLGVTVLHVGRSGETSASELEEAAASLRAAGLDAVPRAETGEPEEVLRNLIKDEGFDLLVMGAYGHSRIRSLIIGSTTTALVRAAQIPVLLYR